MELALAGSTPCMKVMAQAKFGWVQIVPCWACAGPHIRIGSILEGPQWRQETTIE